jgi:hypothetical protein
LGRVINGRKKARIEAGWKAREQDKEIDGGRITDPPEL